MFRSERTCLLVDPLLCEEFGHTHALDYRVFPPRVLQPENFPRIDAVLLTHEHDDGYAGGIERRVEPHRAEFWPLHILERGP